MKLSRRDFIKQVAGSTIALGFLNIGYAKQRSNSSDITIILGRPTDKSITLNIMSHNEFEAYVEYGKVSGSYSNQSNNSTISSDSANVILLGNLLSNTRYYYSLKYKVNHETDYNSMEEYSFHTQRIAGSEFTFTLQSDSHLLTKKHCDPKLYIKTLLNAKNDNPDFHFDLGDTFRTTKIKNPTFASIKELHRTHRDYFGLLCHSAPLFFVLGNHEAELGWLLDGTENNPAVWSAKSRKMHYSNPIPNEFYTGDSVEQDFVGLREDYYAYQWGDALFVAIDPYWYTTEHDDPSDYGSPNDRWNITIGDEQYFWLKETLKNSNAKYKFVFCHHLHGQARGGVEIASLYEWGGHHTNGDYLFNEKRPGWEKPIHQLMVENGVTIFFQGHDHIFAKQELDGIIYQTIPMPADPTFTPYNIDAFPKGDKLPNAGHLRVKVSEQKILVEYIRAFLPKDEVNGHVNGEIAFSYEIGSSTGLDKSNKHFPKQFNLQQNYPNPFNPTTNIKYELHLQSRVVMKIYDNCGNLVNELVNSLHEAGNYVISWNGTDFKGNPVASGNYFCELIAGNFRETKKMIFMK